MGQNEVYPKEKKKILVKKEENDYVLVIFKEILAKVLNSFFHHILC